MANKRNRKRIRAIATLEYSSGDVKRTINVAEYEGKSPAWKRAEALFN
jgi:hypothetical protein